MGIKGNKEVDRAAKEAKDMSGMTTRRLHQESEKFQMAKGIRK